MAARSFPGAKQARNQEARSFPGAKPARNQERDLANLRRILAEEGDLWERAAEAEEKKKKVAARTERSDTNFLARLQGAEAADDAKARRNSLAGLGVSIPVPQGSQQDEDDARKLFAKHDKDRSGTIDETEFAQLYTAMYLQEQILRRNGGAVRHRESTAELKALFRTLDRRKKGQLDVQELISSHETIRSHIAAAARRSDATAVEGIFKSYDKDKSGTIDFREFAEAVRKEQGVVKLSDASHAELKALFAQIDRDGNGSLNLREFNLGLQGVKDFRAQEQQVLGRGSRADQGVPGPGGASRSASVQPKRAGAGASKPLEPDGSEERKREQKRAQMLVYDRMERMKEEQAMRKRSLRLQ